jgi:hypothetical protein
MRLRAVAVAVSMAVAAAGCKPNTPRPPFPPITGAPFADLDLSVSRATNVAADALRQDGLPVSLVSPRDGLIETPWFDASTLAPTGARILGPNVVRIRAWLDPTKPGASHLTMETVYRPLADPSLPERELDRQVPPDHPIGKRTAKIVSSLAKLYGEVTSDSVEATPFAVPEADSARPKPNPTP